MRKIYPDPTPDPWMARRYGVAYAMYDAMGIERQDRAARDAAMALNFSGFGAPVVLFRTWVQSRKGRRAK